MTRLLKFLIIGFWVFSCAIAFAAGTAEDLLRRCEADSSLNSFCAGYITGFYDGRTTKDYGILMWRSCPPADTSGEKLAITYSQMIRVYIKWGRDNPAELHLGDWQAVREAFAKAWPCK